MKTSRRHFLSLFTALSALLGSASLVSAQAIVTPPPQVSVRIACINIDGDDVKGIKMAVGKDAKDVPVMGGMKPAPMFYTGPEDLEFFREAKDAEGRPVRVLAAKVKIPRPSGQFIILFTRNKGAEETYTAYAIPDQEVAGQTTWMLVNLMHRRVKAVYGKQQVILDSGKSVHLDIAKSKDAKGYVDIKCYVWDGRDWTIGYSTRAVATPNISRTIFYLSTPGDPLRVRYKGLNNASSPAPQPATQPAAAGRRY